MDNAQRKTRSNASAVAFHMSVLTRCTCAARCVFLLAQVSHALLQHMIYTALMQYKQLRQTLSVTFDEQPAFSGMHLTQVSTWVSVGSAELSIDADTLRSACQQVTAAGEDLPTSAIV